MKSVREIEIEEALLVEKMAQLKPGCDRHRKLAAKRERLHREKASRLAQEPEILSKAAVPVPAVNKPPPSLDAAEEEITSAMLRLPVTDATAVLHAKLRATLDSVRAARSASALPPDGKVLTMKSTIPTAPPQRLFDGSPMAAEWRARTAEERRLADARAVAKAHPAAFGVARDSVTTIAGLSVSTEPAWMAFRRSRLQLTNHPAFATRNS
jgi:hypothetical protein